MPSRFRLIAAAGTALALLAPLPASAASPDAWKDFRRDVEAACLVAAQPLLREPQITVDPFGSPSYGLAFLRGLAAEDGAARSLVCIYHKTTRTAEIGGTMALETAVPALAAANLPASAGVAPAAGSVAAPSAVSAAGRAAPPTVAAAGLPGAPPAAGQAPASLSSSPLPSSQPAAGRSPEMRSQAAVALEQRFLSSASPQPLAAPVQPMAVAAFAPTGEGAAKAFAGQCDATCAVTLAALAEPDRTALVDLAAEVDRTLAAHPGAKLAAGPEAARAAVAALAGSAAGQKTGAVARPSATLAGERSCVLYYFGYENQAARSVARHRCRVTADEAGGLVVDKTSGERLHAELRPLTDEFSAFVGRTFEAGQDETTYDPAKPVSSADKELGNTVGLAAAVEGRLVLVSSQRRRFADQGDFFWVLALDPA